MSYKRLTIPVFLTVFLGLGFSQTTPKTSKPGPKPVAKTASSKTQTESKQAVSETVPPASPNAIFPAVVAKVNGKPIFGRELERLIRRELANIGNPEWNDLRDEYRAQITYSFIQPLISSELIYQKASAMGLQATSAEVQIEFQKVAKNFKSEAEMNAALANDFMDRVAFEKDIDRRLVINKYLEGNVNNKISVTPEEMAKYYSEHPSDFHHPDMVRTRHILIQLAGDTVEEDLKARKVAEGLLARVKAGEDFAKLAQENSMDVSASQGGDIGFAAQMSLAPEYGDAAFSLPLGGVQLVRTSFGYHIIKVTDKKKEGLATLEEAKPSLTEFLRKQKSEAELKKIVEQLREPAKIEYLIPVGSPREP